MSAPPLVSVIMATYNRSNILQYTVGSLLRSTFEDWELVVVGDACTDDTEEVVTGFGDSRIAFHNLPKNVGEQSGPNNEGQRLARGRFFAFLNHDDLWLPQHLEKALAQREKEDADLVFTLGLAVQSDGRRTLSGASRSGWYEPHIAVPASQWLFKRELAREIGPWRFYRECYAAPSQEWLYRVWKAGKVMRLVPEVTVIAVPSGGRARAYARREYSENQVLFRSLCEDPQFLVKELTGVVQRLESEIREPDFSSRLRRAVRDALYHIFRMLRIHPGTALLFLRYRRKGGFIDLLRWRRGLPRKEV